MLVITADVVVDGVAFCLFSRLLSPRILPFYICPAFRLVFWFAFARLVFSSLSSVSLAFCFRSFAIVFAVCLATYYSHRIQLVSLHFMWLLSLSRLFSRCVESACCSFALRPHALHSNVPCVHLPHLRLFSNSFTLHHIIIHFAQVSLHSFCSLCSFKHPLHAVIMHSYTGLVFICLATFQFRVRFSLTLCTVGLLFRVFRVSHVFRAGVGGQRTTNDERDRCTLRRLYLEHTSLGKASEDFISNGVLSNRCLALVTLRGFRLGVSFARLGMPQQVSRTDHDTDRSRFAACSSSS